MNKLSNEEIEKMICDSLSIQDSINQLSNLLDSNKILLIQNGIDLTECGLEYRSDNSLSELECSQIHIRSLSFLTKREVAEGRKYISPSKYPWWLYRSLDDYPLVMNSNNEICIVRSIDKYRVRLKLLISANEYMIGKRFKYHNMVFTIITKDIALSDTLTKSKYYYSLAERHFINNKSYFENIMYCSVPEPLYYD